MRGMAMAVLVMVALVGCGPSVEEHMLTRSAETGELLAPGESQTSPVGESTATPEYSQKAVSQENGQEATCSGRCNRTQCSCTGSYECCVRACTICWGLTN